MKKNDLILRHIEEDLRVSMRAKPIVALSGPYGSGKTTLAKKIAGEYGMKFISLDDPTTFKQACRNPQSFIKSLASTGGVLDEIQKAPLLIKALEGYVDQDSTPGRFVITAPVNLLFEVPTGFGGKTSWVELSPLSQTEVEGLSSSSAFLEDALESKVWPFPSNPHTPSVDLWPRVLRGGYPRAVLAENSEESIKWLKSYSDLLKNGYIAENFIIRKTGKFKEFITHLAHTSGHWTSSAILAQKLDVKPQTIKRWLGILQKTYIIDWLRNESDYVFRESDSRGGFKVQFLDSGLLASLLGGSGLGTLLKSENKQSLLESFAHGELRKLINDRGDFSLLNSYEHHSGAKVDFVFHRGSHVVGINVKASPALKSHDFEGLRCLRKEMAEDLALEDELKCGVVFYTGEEIHLSDEGFYTVPIGMLWAPSKAKLTTLSTLREANNEEKVLYHTGVVA